MVSDEFAGAAEVVSLQVRRRWEARRRLGGFAAAGGGGDKVGEEDEEGKIKIGLVFK